MSVGKPLAKRLRLLRFGRGTVGCSGGILVSPECRCVVALNISVSLRIGIVSRHRRCLLQRRYLEIALTLRRRRGKIVPIAPLPKRQNQGTAAPSSTDGALRWPRLRSHSCPFRSRPQIRRSFSAATNSPPASSSRSSRSVCFARESGSPASSSG